MRKIWLFAVVLVFGACRNDPIVIYRDVIAVDDVVVGGVLTVDHIDAGSITVDGVTIDNGNINAPGDITAGGTITGVEVVDLPDEPNDNGNDNIDDEPELLTATIRSVDGQTVFDQGELIEYEVSTTGGDSVWSLRCLRPDGQFVVVNDSTVGHFEFSFRINSPGSGTINCKVVSGEQEANVWASITVE